MNWQKTPAYAQIGKLVSSVRRLPDFQLRPDLKGNPSKPSLFIGHDHILVVRQFSKNLYGKRTCGSIKNHDTGDAEKTPFFGG
jgi:hypothetical protein